MELFRALVLVGCLLDVFFGGMFFGIFGGMFFDVFGFFFFGFFFFLDFLCPFVKGPKNPLSISFFLCGSTVKAKRYKKYKKKQRTW